MSDSFCVLKSEQILHLSCLISACISYIFMFAYGEFVIGLQFQKIGNTGCHFSVLYMLCYISSISEIPGI